MKHHLKRIAAPKSWMIDRKQQVFVIKPLPSGHALASGLPLGLVLRDMLKVGSTMAEIKKVLQRAEVKVDGKIRKDPHFMVGLFDVISLAQKWYVMVFDRKGRLEIRETQSQDTKICKVMGRKAIGKGKVQLQLHDGKNTLYNGAVQVGDSVVVGLPALKVEEVLPLKVGAHVYLVGGKYQGGRGVVQEMKSREVQYQDAERSAETLKKYLFVLPPSHFLVGSKA